MKQILLYDVIPEDFEPEGALKDCFNYYPGFAEDFEFLVYKKYIKIITPETCKWLKSITCLAEYLYLLSGNYQLEDDDEGYYDDYFEDDEPKPRKIKKPYTPCGFWAPAEKVFGIKRHKLRKYRGKNGNVLKPKKSRAYKDLKWDLYNYRMDVRIKKDENDRYLKILMRIRRIIKKELDTENPQTISRTIKKIGSLIPEMWTKKNLIQV